MNHVIVTCGVSDDDAMVLIPLVELNEWYGKPDNKCVCSSDVWRSDGVAVYVVIEGIANL